MGSFGRLTQLALLTGMRRGELSGLRWPDIRDRIALEARHTKGGAAHEIPLTELMRATLAKQPSTSSALVFPSSRANGRISGWTKLVNRLVKESGVELTMHDTRRTCRTLMSRLGVNEDIAELAIGHRRADLVARYNKDLLGRDGSRRSSRYPHIVATIAEKPTDNVTYLQCQLKR